MVMNDMTDDGKWGAEVPIVDGKRPEWLTAGDRFRVFSHEGEWSEPYAVSGVTPYAWANDIRAIRLPAEHPHYQQRQSIDWSAPIEAVHEDGRVVSVSVASFNDDHYEIGPILEDHRWSVTMFRLDGNHIWKDMGVGWRIRNVQPATQTQTQTLTAQERLERMEALYGRLERLCRGLASCEPIVGNKVDEILVAEARALVAEMEPVDPVEAMVDELLMKDWTTRDIVREAVLRGRELARGER